MIKAWRGIQQDGLVSTSFAPMAHTTTTSGLAFLKSFLRHGSSNHNFSCSKHCSETNSVLTCASRPLAILSFIMVESIRLSNDCTNVSARPTVPIKASNNPMLYDLKL